ncbi:MAG: META domain-containing protein [Flavobacteriaceae bacterium]
MKTCILLSLAVMVALNGSCDQSSRDEHGAAETETSQNLSTMLHAATSLENTKWIFQNFAHNPVTDSHADVINLAFGDTQHNTIVYHGRAIVNLYRGQMEIDAKKGLVIKTGPTASTLMGGSEADLKMDDRYHDSMAKATFFELKDGFLYFYLGDKSDPGTEIMTFKKAE